MWRRLCTSAALAQMSTQRSRGELSPFSSARHSAAIRGRASGDDPRPVAVKHRKPDAPPRLMHGKHLPSPRVTPLSEDAAAALAEVSEAFFLDEVAAITTATTSTSTMVPSPHDRTKGATLLEAASRRAAALKDDRRVATSSSVHTESDQQDDLAALMFLDWVNEEGSAQGSCGSCGRQQPLFPSPSSALPGSLAQPLQHEPESSLKQLLTLGNEGNGLGDLKASSVQVQQATELLLQGLDVKAILQDNALHHLHLRHKCLSQSDFSFTTWEDVRAEHCDFSLCVFYKGTLKGPCVFQHCTFDGSVLNGLRIVGGGSVRFVHCTFRRAGLGVVYSPPRKRGAAGEALFLHCDFDLASFDGCTGLSTCPEAFVQSVNTETAAQFPLRARAV